MNIAILIGVPVYSDPKLNLPGCKNDIFVIKETLSAIGKYDETLIIDAPLSSIKTKEKLSEFIEKNQGKDIKEVLFYYTGHGEFRGDDFYYILSEYNEHKFRQTTLENTELDNWLRSLNAEMTVKIIDACQSGVQYVKDVNALQKYVESTHKEFKKCCFMFSSQIDQYSYQDNSLSFFTKSIIDSIVENDGSSIRYKDIVDYVSDYFEGNKSQSPFFVMQSNYTEKYCEINDDIKSHIKQSVDTLKVSKIPTLDQKIDQKEAISDILALVIADAENYCSEEELMQKLGLVENHIKTIDFKDPLNKLFKIETHFLSSYDEMPMMSAIGSWVDEKGSDYFARVIDEKVPYKETIKVVDDDVPDPFGLSTSWARIMGQKQKYKEKEVTKYKRAVRGIELTQEVPFCAIRINSAPNYQNLEKCSCCIVFIVSKVKIIFFASNISYKSINWKESELIDGFKWKFYDANLKTDSNILSELTKIINQYSDFLLESVKSKIEYKEKEAPVTEEAKTEKNDE